MGGGGEIFLDEVRIVHSQKAIFWREIPPYLSWQLTLEMIWQYHVTKLTFAMVTQLGQRVQQCIGLCWCLHFVQEEEECVAREQEGDFCTWLIRLEYFFV